VKKLLSSLMLAVAFATGCASVSFEEEFDRRVTNQNDTLQRMRMATVALQGCSGVMVAPEHVLTAAHCDNGSYEVLKKDAAHDLMLVRFPASSSDVYAKIAGENVKIDDIVHVLGYPLARGVQMRTVGSVQMLDFDIEGVKHLVYSAPTIFGNSGGPVFDASGNVVGIVSKIAVGSMGMFPFPVTHFGFGIGLEQVKEFLVDAESIVYGPKKLSKDAPH
jgi:S1-C subfamily serine protease